MCSIQSSIGSYSTPLAFSKGVSKVLSLREAADKLGVTYTTALKYIRSGVLRGMMYGGQWRVTEAEITRFLTYGNYIKEEEVK